MRLHLRPSLPDRWRAATAFTVGVFLSLAVACAVQGQAVIRRVVMAPEVRGLLAADWKAHENRMGASERVWCARTEIATQSIVIDDDSGGHHAAEDTLIHVVKVEPPLETHDATPLGIGFHCADSTVDLHTHGRTACYTDGAGTIIRSTCTLGGEFANDCMPSPTDLSHEPVSAFDVELLQCDAYAVIAYQRVPIASGPLRYGPVTRDSMTARRGVARSSSSSRVPSPRFLAIPVASVFAASVYAIHADKQWHHEYIGAALLASHHRWVQWVGLAIMVDDAAQHLIQTRDPSYRSPLHKAYAATLYRWGF